MPRPSAIAIEKEVRVSPEPSYHPMTPSPSIGLLEPTIGDPVVKQGAHRPIAQDDLDVAPADGLPPPFVIDLPGILDVLDLAAAVSLVQGDRQTAPLVDGDLNRARKV